MGFWPSRCARCKWQYRDVRLSDFARLSAVRQCMSNLTLISVPCRLRLAPARCFVSAVPNPRQDPSNDTQICAANGKGAALGNR